MKGSTSLRCFCWLQVKVKRGQCPVAHLRASNGRDWPGPGLRAGSPPTDFGQQNHRVESQLPGAASYSHCRPFPVVRHRQLFGIPTSRSTRLNFLHVPVRFGFIANSFEVRICRPR